MDTALGWIGEFVHFIVRWFPHMVIIKSTHAGVKYRWGKVVIPLDPGLHFYWPMVTEFILYPVVRQTMNMEAQALTTRDGETVYISGVVVYNIFNIEAALARNYDIEDTIGDISQTALADKIFEYDFDDLMVNVGDVKKALTIHAANALEEYGVHVSNFGLVEVAKCQVIKTTSHAIPVISNVS